MTRPKARGFGLFLVGLLLVVATSMVLASSLVVVAIRSGEAPPVTMAAPPEPQQPAKPAAPAPKPEAKPAPAVTVTKETIVRPPEPAADVVREPVAPPVLVIPVAAPQKPPTDPVAPPITPAAPTSVPATTPLAPLIAPSLPTLPADAVLPVRPPPEPTVDELLRRLEDLRQQKAEAETVGRADIQKLEIQKKNREEALRRHTADFEQKEKALADQIRVALQKQRDRLSGLGLLEPAPAPRPVPAPPELPAREG